MCHVHHRTLFLFLLKLGWPKNKSFYDNGDGVDDDGGGGGGGGE